MFGVIEDALETELDLFFVRNKVSKAQGQDVTLLKGITTSINNECQSIAGNIFEFSPQTYSSPGGSTTAEKLYGPCPGILSSDPIYH